MVGVQHGFWPDTHLKQHISYITGAGCGEIHDVEGCKHRHSQILEGIAPHIGSQAVQQCICRPRLL